MCPVKWTYHSHDDEGIIPPELTGGHLAVGSKSNDNKSQCREENYQEECKLLKPTGRHCFSTGFSTLGTILNNDDSHPIYVYLLDARLSADLMARKDQNELTDTVQ
jgi:hypothetical protein